MKAETVLDEATCRRLLTEGIVGRVAFWACDGPRLHPVNYAVLDDAVLIRVRENSAMARAAREPSTGLAAFEVDGADYDYHRGWSVQARGPLDELTDPVALDRLERVRPPHPWAPGQRVVVVRLAWEELTGRQLGTGWDPTTEPRPRRLG